MRYRYRRPYYTDGPFSVSRITVTLPKFVARWITGWKFGREEGWKWWWCVWMALRWMLPMPKEFPEYTRVAYRKSDGSPVYGRSYDKADFALDYLTGKVDRKGRRYD